MEDKVRCRLKGKRGRKERGKKKEERESKGINEGGGREEITVN